MKKLILLYTLFVFGFNNIHCAEEPTPAQVLAGLQSFYQKTARADGSFQPGIDPDYLGISDCASSDLAAVTYACTIHKTFGWHLPHEEKTIAFLLARQKPSGDFFNVAGTVDPLSAEGRTYNTTQGLVALHALGIKPTYDPLGVFEEILKKDYKTLPSYSTSFFPLAYLCCGRPIPPQADRSIRALMIQDETGYTNDHVAATFHASHYYSLCGEPTPKARQMVARMLRDQNADGSWLLNMPSRDRHATFDAVFTLVHEGHGDACKAAIAKAAKWALSCRNPDGGFGHFPGSQSDADANYFQVGTLVMAGFLKPAEPLPLDPHLLSWGHLMPVKKPGGPVRFEVPGWVSSLAYNHAGGKLASGCSDHMVRMSDANSKSVSNHTDIVSAVAFSSDDALLASGSYDRTIRIWDAAANEASKTRHTLEGHRGAVLSLAFSPSEILLASASINGTIKLWNPQSGALIRTLEGHKSWVTSIVFERDGKTLLSGSANGTVKLWDVASGQCLKTIQASTAEVRCVALSPDGAVVAGGLRYGSVKMWNRSDWSARPDIKGLTGDVWALAFMADGRLVTGSGDWNLPGQVTFWDTLTGKQTEQLNHTGEVLSLAVSHKSKQLAAGGGDGAVMIWSGK